jgi:hypothetical protein
MVLDVNNFQKMEGINFVKSQYFLIVGAMMGGHKTLLNLVTCVLHLCIFFTCSSSNYYLISMSTCNVILNFLGLATKC